MPDARTVLVVIAAPLLLLMFTREAVAGARSSRPLKTGQTTCWDSAGHVIDCAGTGQDGELRRGEGRAFVDQGDGTIYDERAALMWERLNNNGSVHDMDNRYTWSQAFEKIKMFNTPPCFANLCDWRLPSINELLTLVDWEVPVGAPTIVSAFNQGCVANCSVCSCTLSNSTAAYFSSTTDTAEPDYAFGYNFGGGYLPIIQKTGTFLVRAVRGGRR